MTIQLKRGNTANLTALTLGIGEPAFVLDTGKLYVGNGTDKILINPDQVTNAETASKLITPRTISLTGDVTGSVSFDGSANATIAATYKASGATAGTYPKVTIDAKGTVTAGASLTAADIPSLTASKITDLGTAATKNTGTASGNIPILNASGKIDDSVLPALAITDTSVVATEALMLALTAQVGDIAIRTDLNKTFVLKTIPATALANWQEILSPTAPVQSVAGRSGNVTLTATDVGLANVANESKATMLTSPALTGTPTAPTATAATNTTQIATTAFVKSQAYATLASPALTGTPTAATADSSTKLATTAFVKAQGYLSESSIIDGGTF